VVRSLKYCQQHKALQVYAWVILDNHFHAIAAGPNLAKTIGDLRRFISHEILDQLRREGRDWLLNQLAYFCARHKSGSSHQLWQEGVHPQAIPSDEVMFQKLEYLHNNPVKRGFVAAPEHWVYSSAHEWLPGAMPVMNADPWR
jgi:putative transposase